MLWKNLERTSKNHEAMKKFIYLCGMILLSVNVIAQIGNNRQLDDSLYCDNRIKELTVNYHSTNIPITLGWRYDSIYSDEFSNPPIDTRKWVIRDRKWQSPKKQIGYVNSYDNVHIENGKLYLNITTNDDSIVCNCPWDTTNLKYHAPELLSGWIQSTDTTKIRYGYIETKCYLPKNHNYWPCFWTTGRYKTNNYDDYDEDNGVSELIEKYKTIQINDKYLEFLKKVAKFVGIFRENPHLFVKYYLNINLKDFQKVLLWEFVHNNYSLYIASRG